MEILFESCTEIICVKSIKGVDFIYLLFNVVTFLCLNLISRSRWKNGLRVLDATVRNGIELLFM